jgi:hypothetical protein
MEPRMQECLLDRAVSAYYFRAVAAMGLMAKGPIGYLREGKAPNGVNL